MYHSPFREDKDASMKVDYNQNLWIDYGTGEGGTIIDLVMRIDNVSLNDRLLIRIMRSMILPPSPVP